MQRAEFVAIRVAQIGQILFAHRAVAKPRRLLTRRATIGNACVVERNTLLKRVHVKPYCAAIALRCRLAVSHASFANGSEGVEIVSAVLHEAAHSGDWQRSVSYSKCIIADDNIDAV